MGPARRPPRPATKPSRNLPRLYAAELVTPLIEEHDPLPALRSPERTIPAGTPRREDPSSPIQTRPLARERLPRRAVRLRLLRKHLTSVPLLLLRRRGGVVCATANNPPPSRPGRRPPASPSSGRPPPPPRQRNTLALPNLPATRPTPINRNVADQIQHTSARVDYPRYFYLEPPAPKDFTTSALRSTPGDCTVRRGSMYSGD